MRFNSSSKQSTRTRNHEDGVAYKESPELELYSLAVTSMLADKFYESSDDRLARLRDLLKRVKPEYAARLAIYCRTKMYLRSFPLVMAVELAKIHKGDSLISSLIPQIVNRADEITEILAYYQLANERKETKKLNKLSKQIQKGLSIAFHKFSEYEFAKYNRDGQVKLRDALFLVHPKARAKGTTTNTPNEDDLFKKIVDDKLETPYTWEVELSKGGDKKETWEQLIESGKLGYMAMLRNLRNMLDVKIDKRFIKAVATRLSTKNEVEKSKQFPYRFLSAYKELEGHDNAHVSVFIDALDEALSHSVANLRGFDNDPECLVATDSSGSMDSMVSEKSKMSMAEIGFTLGVLLKRKLKFATVGAFGEEWQIANVPSGSTLAAIDKLKSLEVGHSTNGYLVIKDALRTKSKYDKMFFFTDCQMWDSSGYDQSFADQWHLYKALYPEAKLYIFDLQGHGTTPVSTFEKDVYFIAGWSERIFEMLEALERGSSAIVEIEKIGL